MKNDLQTGLQNIIDAINNLIEPKLGSLRYDKTFRAKVISDEGNNVYGVQINGKNYKAVYTGEKIPVGQIVKVKAPLNNFSDIYIETLPGSGSGSAGNYNDLLNKPILNTNNTGTQVPSATETIQGTISLHKVSKTGNYNDLLNKPTLDFIPTSEKGGANGVAGLDENKKVSKSNLPTDTVYDNNYVHTDNNFTTAMKNKLDSVEEGAEPNKIEIIQRNGSVLPINNKIVNVEVPTKTSDLTNDNGFISSIPVASDTMLGGIKVGENLSITADGVLSAKGGGTTDYSVLLNKPVLNTANTKSLAVDSNETINGVVSLHKISKTGSYEDLLNKPTIPTKTSGLENDSGFITNTVNDLTNYYLKSETYTQSEVNNLIGQIKTISIEVVNTLPTTGEDNKIYLVPKEGSTGDVYNEYIWVNNTWELIGSTQVDLTGYATQDWVNNQIKDFLNESQVTQIVNNSLTNYYTKTETYSKTEVNNLLNGKANADDIPTKTSDLTNDSGFIDNSVDNLENYYKKSETYNQTEINNLLSNKADISDIPTKTGDLTNNGDGTTGSKYITNSDLNTELESKQDKITGGATTIVTNDLTVNRALVSNANGKVAVSNTTSTELGYLSGARSNLQSQIDTITTEGGQPNVIEVVQENGAPLEITNKTVNVIAPTNLVNGIAVGSLRTVGSTKETNTYKLGQYAFAEGRNTRALGDQSHVEGNETMASGSCSHAEGYNTTASGNHSHAEGSLTKASSVYSHAEGFETLVQGQAGHAEGGSTKAMGYYSHAEGQATVCYGHGSHAEGTYTRANADGQHTQGKYNIVDTAKQYAHIVGNGTADDARSNAHTLDWNGNSWYAGDLYTGGTSQTDTNAKKIATEEYVDNKVVTDYDKLTNRPTLNTNVTTSQPVRESELITGEMVLHKISKTGDYNDLNNKLNIMNGSATGSLRTIYGPSLNVGEHSFSENGLALGDYSHAEGSSIVGRWTFTIVSEDSTAKTYTLDSVALLKIGMSYSIKSESSPHYINQGTITAIDTDTNTITVSYYTDIEGDSKYLYIYNRPDIGTVLYPYNNSQAIFSHAEGYETYASGKYAHSEGRLTYAVGSSSHAEGEGTNAYANDSHAEGENTVARGDGSHSEGHGTIANGKNQHVQGKYNIADTTSLDIIGNGTTNDNRSNAYTLDTDGNAWYSGEVYVGSTSGTNKDSGSVKLAKITDLDTKVDKTTTIAGINLQDNITVSELADALKVEMLKIENPVGHIRMETTNTNPATYLGFGTWVLWGSGKVPVGVNTSDSSFNAVEKTGGSKTVNISHSHTIASHNHGGNTGSTVLTVNQIPAHTHDIWQTSGGSAQSVEANALSGATAWSKTLRNVENFAKSKGGGAGHTHTISESGQQTTKSAGSTSLSLLQPYITCYMWKRTA